MAPRVPSRGSDQFNLRFPDGMRESLKEEAAKNGRSLNAEIIHRLETTLKMESFHYRTGHAFPTADQMQAAADTFMAMLEYAKEIGVVDDQADADEAISKIVKRTSHKQKAQS